MEETLLVVGLEHDVLRIMILQCCLEVDFHRRFAVAGLGLGLREPLQPARREPHVLADRVVAAHGAREAAAPIGLEVEDLAGLLDHPVEKPLLFVALPVWPAGFGTVGAGHEFLSLGNSIYQWNNGTMEQWHDGTTERREGKRHLRPGSRATAHARFTVRRGAPCRMRSPRPDIGIQLPRGHLARQRRVAASGTICYS